MAALTERIGSRIRERREELAMSAWDLARELPGKTSDSQIYRWEKGRHAPKPDTLEALALALKVDVVYFMAPGNHDIQPTDGVPTQLDRIEAKLSELLDLARGVALLMPDVQNAADVLGKIAEAAEPTLRLIEAEAAKQPPAAEPRPRTPPQANSQPESDPTRLPDAGNGHA